MHMVLVPILDVTEHVVRGERRWTGRAYLPGRLNRPVLVLQAGDVLIGVHNRCPHRPNMPMLMGRLDVVDNFLECPGHGWQMRLDGSELGGRPVIERDGQYFLEF